MPGKFLQVPGKNRKSNAPGYIFNSEHGPGLDRFYLSPTHYSLVLYAVLAETGHMAEEGLREFNKDGGIVEMIGAEHSPGMEVMTGSLGQGISQAAGIALARRLRQESGRNWIFMSDGELQPGQVWEAIQSMVFYQLDNIAIYVDVNGFQCDGSTSAVMGMEPLADRFRAFGASVKRINGHDIHSLLESARITEKGKPQVVICDTVPWMGLELLKKRAPKFHYIRFQNEAELGLFQEILTKMNEEHSASWKF
jgi:transketolase